FFWLPSAGASDEVRPEIGHDHKLILHVTHPRKIPKFRQLRYVSRLLGKVEKRFTLAALFLFLLSGSISLMFLIRQRMVLVPVAGDSVKEALIGEPRYLNPLDAPSNSVDRDISSLIFSGLFRMNGMEPEPDLAERYEWSPDGKKLTVTLRPGAQFHNGDPITAYDVQFTIDSIQNISRTSPLEPRFRGVKTTAINDTTVQFDLDHADLSFLTALTVGILPSNIWQEILPENARLADSNLKPIGSGPYRFKSFMRDSRGIIRSFTLERFEKFYGNKPFIKTVIFQFYPDRKQAEDALKGELVDALAFANISDEQKNSLSRWHFIQLGLPQETVAFFNLKKPVFSDDKVRTALAGVIERDQVVSSWREHAVPVSDPYPFTEASTTVMDIEKARELLDAAGWRLPENGNVRIFTKDSTSTKLIANASSTELSLTMITSDQTELAATAEYLKRRWSLLGVKINVQQLDQTELLRLATRERTSDVILTNVLLNSEQDLFPFWWSGQVADRGLNISGLADRDVDATLDATRAATNTADLQTARENLSKIIEKSIPAIFLVRPSSRYVVANKIKGVNETPIISQPSDRFNDLMNWYVKTGWRWR
ncbi:peptide ABC transporter substrate-binding protein, partial [Patescibacteria group bacterium]|nr:peptide ABC transporter substrate-binding protein [Patescibacteria group bacterium]MBU1629726.1 peptide ABC transporter substrate-binding protein [Patescibacteria group bacterium]